MNRKHSCLKTGSLNPTYSPFQSYSTFCVPHSKQFQSSSGEAFQEVKGLQQELESCQHQQDRFICKKRVNHEPNQKLISLFCSCFPCRKYKLFCSLTNNLLSEQLELRQQSQEAKFWLSEWFSPALWILD